MLDNGTTLSKGLAHGSLHVPNTVFNKWYEPEYREKDDNRRRHAGYFAIYDWCWGDDMQWLYDLRDDWKLYSHDHGLFFPGGTQWAPDTLALSVDAPREIDAAATGLDPNELRRIASRLDSIEVEDILKVLADVPKSWPIDDNELGYVGWFLASRTAGVGQRMRRLAELNSRSAS